MTCHEQTATMVSAQPALYDPSAAWNDCSAEEQLDYILQDPEPLHWTQPAYLETFCLFRHNKQRWAEITTRALQIRVHLPTWMAAVDEACAALHQAGLLPAVRNPFATTATAPQLQPVLLPLAAIEARAPEWLWEPYLAKGTIVMLDGDPGLGKSLLSIQLAACLSRGFPLPDQGGTPSLATGDPQHVILITSEDSPEHTIKPRLLAAGGDPAYVHILTGWTNPAGKDPEEVHAFTLKDIPVLEAALTRYPAALVVIDPLQAYLGKVDMHRSNETRPLMAKLGELARRHNTVILCIRHPSKPGGHGGGRAIHMGLGSIDFIGIARSGLNVLPHPCDPHKALLAHGKNNLGPCGKTLVFSKAEGQFQWAGVSRLAADTLVAPGCGPEAHRLLEACFWLEHRLASCGVPVKQIEEDAEEEGLKWTTVNRAKKLLGVRSTRLGTFATPLWLWELPPLRTPRPPTPADLGDHEDLGDLGDLDNLRQDQPLTETVPLETLPLVATHEDLQDLQDDLDHLVCLDRQVPPVREEDTSGGVPANAPESDDVIPEMAEDAPCQLPMETGIPGDMEVEADVANALDAPCPVPAVCPDDVDTTTIVVPCHVCHGTQFWWNSGGQLVCAICHPRPVAPSRQECLLPETPAVAEDTQHKGGNGQADIARSTMDAS